jgi:hypothetical protein
MAFDKTPTSWLSDWSEDGTNITVPIATFPELTAAEADAVTGDIRKIVFAIVEKFYQTYIATATADLPTKWKMSKTATVSTTRNVIASRYTITIETEIGTQEVRDEASATPSATVSATPSATPSNTVSHTPSSTPSATVSATPSNTVSQTPSSTPSNTVSATPSSTKSNTPSSTPSNTVSATPSHTSS